MNKSATQLKQPEELTIDRPADWPMPGEPVDLNLQDLPHASSGVEWWYINGHFTGDDEQEYSIFASFFRKLISIDEITNEPEYAHSITWAIIDVSNEKYYHNSLVDKNTPEIGIQRLNNGEILKDRFLKKAALEMLEKGAVPYPDRMFESDVTVANDRLDLNFDKNVFCKNNDGSYSLRCMDKEHQVSCSIDFTPEKPVIKNGDDGIVSGVSGEEMYYYFIPCNRAQGEIKIHDANINMDVEGMVWYDHQFGCTPRSEDDGNIGSMQMDTAWNWISGQLTNGYEFTAANLINLNNREVEDSCLIIIDDKGRRLKIEDFSLEPAGAVWTSMRTFHDYPLQWKLSAPDYGVNLLAHATFAEQEFSTVISKQAFWEGRMNIEGELFNEEVHGIGFLELNGYTTLDTLEEFFKVVSRETIKTVDTLLPLKPNDKELNALITKSDSDRFSNGVSAEVYSQSVIEPIRAITDRGGKSWRSYAAIACCDIVGGDPHKVRHWLPLPELMHVGSLIVDDVQDSSAVRRGGPACHKIFGEPLAINAGSACYFISQMCMYNELNISDPERLKIYDYYFEALRAGHSGQALDIYGLDHMMEEVIEDNGGRILEERVLAIHKLKCAAPSYYLARIGAILGGGSDVQSKALGTFYEALGIGFQIIDDTLNIAGFKNDLKTKAEDITAGKITYPIAKAMHQLNKSDRTRLWYILQQKSDKPEMIEEAVDLLVKVDALNKCEREAREIIDAGWQALEPHIRDSMPKLYLRAFSWYVLERHY